LNGHHHREEAASRSSGEALKTAPRGYRVIIRGPPVRHNSLVAGRRLRPEGQSDDAQTPR